MSQTSQDRVIGLWATPFLHFTPEGHETQQAALVERAINAPETDLLLHRDAAVQWLRGQIEDAVAACLARWAETEVGPATVTSRTLVHGHSDYQPLRNHPEAYLSGLYFIAVPKDVRDTHHRFDADSNALSFYDPRFAMNMGAIAKDPNFEMEKQVRPDPGVMIAWPSYVDYFMHPNLSASPMVAVQFNAVPGGPS